MEPYVCPNMKQNELTSGLSRERRCRAAFHAAGHAAGIYLNTKSRHLPPAFFRITFKDIACATEAETAFDHPPFDDCMAQVEGGRLIQSLPHYINSLLPELREHDEVMLQSGYMALFETDIINLLVGPLAEAKHIADIDDELFNHQLVNLKALNNYGGMSNLVLVNEYLQIFSGDKQKDQKRSDLFTRAFDFVSNDANWSAITQLANYILAAKHKNTMCYEEVVALLDRAIANFKDRRAVARHRHNAWFKAIAPSNNINDAGNIKNEKCPSQTELDAMSHSEKDALIFKLFSLL